MGKKGSSGIKTHSVHTDNCNFASKVKLRADAVASLPYVNVLDCFAGENRIWKEIPHIQTTRKRHFKKSMDILLCSHLQKILKMV